MAENLGPFDYVIVGAGSAGCVLANRLSADPATRVLLLEAGGRDNYFWIWIPVGYLFTINNPRTDWCFRTEAEPGLNGRALNYARGRVLGGCSSINAMIYMRGQQSDYDHWAALGNRGWSWREILPYFIRVEDYAHGADELHGAGGELRVEERRVSWEILDAWREAAAECGIPKIAEFNRGDNFGNAYFQVNQRRGVRVNMVRAFLTPVRHRPNLTVLTDVHARRVAVERGDGGPRATGVEIRRQDGSTSFVAARREVVLAAGAIGSPQLLQLSGIGPGALLQAHGIPVLHALPGVGENLHDHLQIRLMYKVRNTRTLNERANSLVGKALMGLEYLLFRTGPLTMPPSQLGAFAKSDPAQPSANIEWHVQPLSLDKFGDPLHPFPAITPVGLQPPPDEPGPCADHEPRSPRPSHDLGELPRHPRGPAGRDRRDALHPPDHGRAGPRPLRARRMAPGSRRRIRRGPAPRRRGPGHDDLPSGRHVPDGPGSARGRGRPAARARRRPPAGRRRLRHAPHHLGQYQRADRDDRREGRGADPGRRLGRPAVPRARAVQ